MPRNRPLQPTARRASAAEPARGRTERLTANLADFDDLDYNVFTGQKWTELQSSPRSELVTGTRVVPPFGPRGGFAVALPIDGVCVVGVSVISPAAIAGA